MTSAIIIALLSGIIIFGVFYIRYLIKQVKNISDDLVVIRGILVDYEESLKGVYETEMFYGEPTLQALVEKTKYISDQLDEIIEDYEYPGQEPFLQEVEYEDEET